MKRWPIAEFHWIDPDNVVHEMSDVIKKGYDVLPSRIKSKTGECRTTCGVCLGDDSYFWTRRQVTCLLCLVGEFGGWRDLRDGALKRGR